MRPPDAGSSSDPYARAGVDVSRASDAIGRLVSVLSRIDPGRPSRSVIGAGHYASVLALDDRIGIAICTDGVGTKLIVAEQTGRFDTIGVDCVAMNVNDVICVGAEPLALVDYIAVEQADPDVLEQVAVGLRAGAEKAGVEIPGGELAQVPELIRGHPSPHGLDLVGSCFGVVELDAVVTGEGIEPGDVVIGLPSSGIHSNGLTLARRALLEEAGYSLDDAPDELGRTIGDELLEPTEIYVMAVVALLRSRLDVRGLAHITGDGLLNLLRLKRDIGYVIDDPLPAQPIFELIERAGNLSAEDMHTTFNMGTGFCCIVAAGDADAAVSLLHAHHAGARPIGRARAGGGAVTLPGAGISGVGGGFRAL